MPTKQFINFNHLLWLLAALMLVIVPHVAHLPVWVALTSLIFFLWRLHIAHQKLSLPSRWLLVPIILALMFGLFLQYGTWLGKDAGVALLIMMLSLKLLETNSLRDAMVLLTLGYFLVITNFLYTQSIPIAIYMLLAVWILTANIVTLQQAKKYFEYRSPLRISATLLIQAVPITLVLFLLFPRVHGPLWGQTVDTKTGVTGLSDSMSPGSLSSLARSDAIAFRVKFEAGIPKLSDLYWRGPVLTYLNGGTWTTAWQYRTDPPSFKAFGQPIYYAITLEPHNQIWLFALDLPQIASIPPWSKLTREFQLVGDAPIIRRTRYDLVSYLYYNTSAQESATWLRRHVQLPYGFNPRALALAKKMRAEVGSDEAMVTAVLKMFRTEEFTYTLSPPVLGKDSVDEFLFDTKRGFCEHFSSSFTVLMRAANIPARVVTGYQGGELNAFDNYLVVRQADAHAWSEVWLKDKGWVRVDPTAAVSPLRIERGVAAALPASEGVPLLMRDNYTLLHRARFMWEALGNSWNQWVIGYNPERQLRLMSQFGLNNASWRSMTIALVSLCALVLMFLAVMLLIKLRSPRQDAVVKAYQDFCNKLARKNLPRAPTEGARDYAARLTKVRPELTSPVQAITALYLKLRYTKASINIDNDALMKLQRLVKAFKA